MTRLGDPLGWHGIDVTHCSSFRPRASLLEVLNWDISAHKVRMRIAVGVARGVRVHEWAAADWWCHSLVLLDGGKHGGLARAHPYALLWHLQLGEQTPDGRAFFVAVPPETAVAYIDR